jgi:hypothetical protein
MSRAAAAQVLCNETSDYNKSIAIECAVLSEFSRPWARALPLLELNLARLFGENWDYLGAESQDYRPNY